MPTNVNCPRCNGEDNTGTPGYIFWEQATDSEQQARPDGPDGDNEIHCPLCHPFTELDSGEVPADVAAEWERSQRPSNAPPAKFRLEWTDKAQEAAHVVAISEGQEVTIGLLSFQGNGWDFVRVDHKGTQIPDGVVHIECGPEKEAHFRQMEEESRTNAANATVLRGHLKAIEVQRSLYREDTRDLAILGAHVEARRWWRVYADKPTD